MILVSDTPNYLPDIQWFARILAADTYILADDIQFSSSRKINRCQVKTAAGTEWLTVPTVRKGQSFPLIQDARIDNTKNWRRKHRRTIELSYKYAPYFDWYAPLLEQVYHQDWDKLAELNLALLHNIFQAMQINFAYKLSSSMKLEGNATQRIIQLCEKCDANTYLAPAEANTFMNQSAFDRARINLVFFQPAAVTYPQQFGGFSSNLSIVDLLFNSGPETVTTLKRMSPK